MKKGKIINDVPINDDESTLKVQKQTTTLKLND